MTSQSSIYQIGGSLKKDAPSYVTRQADTELYDGLKAGDFCYVLNARQMGKSSLRVRTIQRLQADGFACATVDISSIGTEGITQGQWYNSVIDAIANDLHLYPQFNFASWSAPLKEFTLVYRLSKFIEDIVLPAIYLSMKSIVFAVCRLKWRISLSLFGLVTIGGRMWRLINA